MLKRRLPSALSLIAGGVSVKPSVNLSIQRNLSINSSTHLRLFSSSVQRDAEKESARERRAYWRKLYESQQDVFTLEDVNHNLAKNWEHLGLSSSASSMDSSSLPRVLVPCCGRDLSMPWMVEKYGVAVVGVDFVGEPLRALAHEIGGGLKPIAEIPSSAPHLSTATAYQVNSLPQLILLHGDLLHLQSPNDYGGHFDACWDRAALTAVDPSHRALYVKKLAEALKPKGRLLLEFLSSNVQLEGGGVVSLDKVKELLEMSGFEGIKVLQKKDVRNDFPSFTPNGLKNLDEVVIVTSKTT